jgi:hypothetical protein
MPLVSEAQRRYAYAHPEQAWTKEFIAATPKGKLPERAGHRRKHTASKVHKRGRRKIGRH